MGCLEFPVACECNMTLINMNTTCELPLLLLLKLGLGLCTLGCACVAEFKSAAIYSRDISIVNRTERDNVFICLFFCIQYAILKLLIYVRVYNASFDLTESCKYLANHCCILYGNDWLGYVTLCLTVVQ